MKSPARRFALAPPLATVALLVALLPVSPAAAKPPPEKSTAVIHGVTFSVVFPDDICGPRASTTTFTLRTQMIHVTERTDGSFNFQHTETGTYHVDFDDPSLPDEDSQFTDSIHHVRTPAGTDVINLAFHDFFGDIRIWERLHFTRVGERLVVEREILKVTGCP